METEGRSLSLPNIPLAVANALPEHAHEVAATLAGTAGTVVHNARHCIVESVPQLEDLRSRALHRATIATGIFINLAETTRSNFEEIAPGVVFGIASVAETLRELGMRFYNGDRTMFPEISLEGIYSAVTAWLGSMVDAVKHMVVEPNQDAA